MKRKRAVSPVNFLKVHTLLFTIFVVLMSQSMLATFVYPANVVLSFDHFKFFVIERVTLMLLWGVLLLGHFGVHYIRSGLQGRDADGVDAQRLEDQAEAAEDTEVYAEARKAKSG